MKSNCHWLVLAALSTTWACSSGSAPVDIGDSRTGQNLDDYAAVWEGYVEAARFADGSDRVKVRLDASGNGSLEIGDSGALPTATNGDIGYPATFDGTQGQVESLFPGASYPITGAIVESKRLRFSVNPWEVERDWCSLQTSYAVVEGTETRYRCVPGHQVYVPVLAACTYNDGTVDVPVDCMKFALCTGPNLQACSCDATGCAVYEAPPQAQGNYTHLDAALEDEGDSLVGTLRTGSGRNMTVRLKRL